MANNSYYDYRYYIDGRYLGILQRSLDLVYDPYVTLDEDIYVTPTVSDSSAILVRFTVRSTLPTSETSDLGLSRNLEHAVVWYVRAKLAEESGDLDRYSYCMNKFHEKIQREYPRRYGLKNRVIVPSHVGVIK